MSIPQTPAMKWRWNPLEVDARLKSSIKQLGSKSLRAIFPGITELIETSTFSNSIELFASYKHRYILYKDKIILSPYQLITVITEAALAYDPQSALSSEADISNSGRKIRRKTSLNGALGSSLLSFIFSRQILEMISLRLDKENFQKTLNEPSPKKKSTSYIISDDSFDEEDEILPKPDVLAEKLAKETAKIMIL
ncbi:uncharacterized protein SAPINGB_P004294 [Magnusiomyces paraingens]|uniref:Uncharacterized protein n=1 Tax=Magnusiomyces paraingens TaxID=2606893 RepID=A0A5E8BUQ3_9ASCO|nr:uncharacterized protein SAPINGB_P004294 [Saprochaete ingens]VVT54851.1 unnamed protein product [Saprochaete ingens]